MNEMMRSLEILKNDVKYLIATNAANCNVQKVDLQFDQLDTLEDLIKFDKDLNDEEMFKKMVSYYVPIKSKLSFDLLI